MQHMMTILHSVSEMIGSSTEWLKRWNDSADYEESRVDKLTSVKKIYPLA